MQGRISRRAVIAAAVVVLAPLDAPAEKAKATSASVQQVIEIARQLALPAGLPSEFQKALGGVVEKLKGDQDAAKSAWKALVEKHKAGLSESLITAVARWLVRESVIEPVPELANAADRARFAYEKKLAAGTQIKALTKLKQGKAPYKVYTLTLAEAYAPGAPASKLASVAKELTLTELEAELKKVEEQLNDVGDDAQLANANLQSVIQQQQQTLRLLSQVSKMVHDTAMAVIRKIGG